MTSRAGKRWFGYTLVGAALLLVPTLAPAKAAVPEPDLVVLMTGVPSGPAGQARQVKLSVKNVGVANAGRFEVAVKGPWLAHKWNIPSLRRGQSKLLTVSWTPKSAGSHKITSVVDTRKQVREMRENNNVTFVTAKVTATKPPAQKLPDLVVSMTRPPSLPPGKPRPVHVTLRNAGPAYAGKFEVRLTGPGINETWPIGGLPGGSIKKLVATWTPPTAGNAKLVVQVDPRKQVVESNENNNASAQIASVPGKPQPQPQPGKKRADLVASIAQPPNLPAGNARTVRVTVRNIGSASATRFDARITGPNLNRTWTVNGLGRGQSRALDVSWTPKAAGSAKLVVNADIRNQVSEMVENNNFTTRTVTVSGGGGDKPPSSGADLVVSIRKPDQLPSGRSRTVSVDVENRGGKQTGSFYVRIQGQGLNKRWKVNRLGGAQSQRLSTSWRPAVPGSLPLIARVDTTKRVVETNENNNYATTVAVVTKPAPPSPKADLVVYMAPPASTFVGRERDVILRVQNRGQVAASNVEVSVNGPKLNHKFKIPRLAPGRAETLQTKWTPTSSGRPTVVAKVDPRRRISETDEDNNQATAVVTVRRRKRTARGSKYRPKTVSVQGRNLLIPGNMDLKEPLKLKGKKQSTLGQYLDKANLDERKVVRKGGPAITLPEYLEQVARARHLIATGLTRTNNKKRALIPLDSKKLKKQRTDLAKRSQALRDLLAQQNQARGNRGAPARDPNESAVVDRTFAPASKPLRAELPRELALFGQKNEIAYYNEYTAEHSAADDGVMVGSQMHLESGLYLLGNKFPVMLADASCAAHTTQPPQAQSFVMLFDAMKAGPFIIPSPKTWAAPVEQPGGLPVGSVSIRSPKLVGEFQLYPGFNLELSAYFEGTLSVDLVTNHTVTTTQGLPQLARCFIKAVPEVDLTLHPEAALVIGGSGDFSVLEPYVRGRISLAKGQFEAKSEIAATFYGPKHELAGKPKQLDEELGTTFKSEFLSGRIYVGLRIVCWADLCFSDLISELADELGEDVDFEWDVATWDGFQFDQPIQSEVQQVPYEAR